MAKHLAHFGTVMSEIINKELGTDYTDFTVFSVIITAK
jgi:hypothetical protein